MNTPDPKNVVEISGQSVIIYERPSFPDDAKSQLCFGGRGVGVFVNYGAHL